MPTIGGNCHELRVEDATKKWRVFYFVDDDAIFILEVFNKTTRQTPDRVLDTCRTRLANYKQTLKAAKKGE